VNDQAQPAKEAGDRLRVALLIVALSGLAGAYFARDEASTWLAASVLFGLAIASCLVSLFTLKAREIARLQARRRGEAEPHYDKWDLHASWTWDSLAFALILAGGVLAAVGWL
jgi:hypothetical protein